MPSLVSHRAVPGALSIAACALSAYVAVTAPALAAGPFGSFTGAWSGGGQVRFENGRSESIRCTAYYTPKDGGAALSLAIRCGNSSGTKIELRGNLSSRGSQVSGSWEERNFNATGDVSGQASGNRISLSISGGVTGSMSVNISGSSQAVSITTSGTGFKGLSINLSRSG